jgi:hypothetical protein
MKCNITVINSEPHQRQKPLNMEFRFSLNTTVTAHSGWRSKLLEQWDRIFESCLRHRALSDFLFVQRCPV